MWSFLMSFICCCGQLLDKSNYKHLFYDSPKPGYIWIVAFRVKISTRLTLSFVMVDLNTEILYCNVFKKLEFYCFCKIKIWGLSYLWCPWFYYFFENSMETKNCLTRSSHALVLELIVSACVSCKLIIKF